MQQSPPNKPPQVDERLWPLILVLTVWAGGVSAAIFAADRFDDPRPWMNGVVRLLTVGTTWAALVWAVTTIYPTRARRLKTAVAASLAVHSLLAIALHEAWIEFPAVSIPPPVASTAEPFENKEVILPEHVRDPIERQSQAEFERPLATDRPVVADNQLARRPPPPGTLTKTTPPLARNLHSTPRTAPPLRQPEDNLAAAFALPMNSTERRRATTRVTLPKRAVAVPEFAAQHRSNDDSVAALAAPSVEPVTRTVPPSAASIVSTIAAPPTAGEANRPTLAPLPPRLDEENGAAGSLPSPTRREPRLALLPTTSGGRRFSLANPPESATRRPAPAFAARIESTERTRNRDPLRSQSRDTANHRVDASIALGLEFLAGIQRDDGRWEFNYLGGAVDAGSEQPSIQADAAATGMALLAYFGAGHDHLSGRYRRVVGDGLDYLVRIQDDSGALFPEDGRPTGQVARFYGHGIATLALCEAYGMTGDARLRRPAQRAIEYLIDTQHGDYGGWRYVPGVNADLSVTGWQLIALRSGRLAGLAVPAESISQIRGCLERCRDDQGEGALFRYNPWASPSDPTTRHGREPSTVMTSVGMVMQLYLDADRGNPQIERGAEHLLANLPQAGDSPIVAPTGTLGNPQRDTYYWYYGTQAMYSLGGDYWSAWRGRLEPLLVESQLTTGPAAGSWDPFRPVPDKWADYGGRLYVTTLNLLSLEVERRYLPVQHTAVPRLSTRPGE
jgi:hypothetical protein